MAKRSTKDYCNDLTELLKPEKPFIYKNLRIKKTQLQSFAEKLLRINELNQSSYQMQKPDIPPSASESAEGSSGYRGQVVEQVYTKTNIRLPLNPSIPLEFYTLIFDYVASR
jgi:hypothetical protein|tara:strand:- start:99 stop:434 length:336 start_codon:yes stop_codon:yes gene_type:complete